MRTDLLGRALKAERISSVSCPTDGSGLCSCGMSRSARAEKRDYVDPVAAWGEQGD